MIHQFIHDEKFTNVQRAQSGLTKIFTEAKKSRSFYRVMRNDEALGVLLPNDLWMSLIEDLEALSSPRYLKRIADARAETELMSMAEVTAKLDL